MPPPALFSAPVAVILNKRLISQRGGFMPSAQNSDESLRFKLFINSSPSSARYGLTLQISALRSMATEHNLDQIPEYQAYIFFPERSFFHFNCMTPSRLTIPNYRLEELDTNEEQARDIERMVKMFWTKSDEDFNEVRHLRVSCWNALIDKAPLPKLRSEALESELKRIFGTIEIANELDNACLELDCLLPTMKGETDKAVSAMHDAAQKDADDWAAKSAEELKTASNAGGSSSRSWRPVTSDMKDTH